MQEPRYTVWNWAGGHFPFFFFPETPTMAPKWGSQTVWAAWASAVTTWVAIKRCPALLTNWGHSSSDPTEPDPSLAMFVLIQLNIKKKKEQSPRDSQKRASCHQGLHGAELPVALGWCSESSRKGAAQFTVSIKNLVAGGNIQENRMEEPVSVRWVYMGSRRREGTRLHRIPGGRKEREKDRADGRSRWIPVGRRLTVCHRNQRR